MCVDVERQCVECGCKDFEDIVCVDEDLELWLDGLGVVDGKFIGVEVCDCDDGEGVDELVDYCVVVVVQLEVMFVCQLFLEVEYVDIVELCCYVGDY